MIMVGRQPSIAAGVEELRARVPRPRAGRLPERRHERPGAAAGGRGRRGVAARAARARAASGKALVRGDQIERIDPLRERAAGLLGCDAGRAWRSPARPPTASTRCCTRSTSGRATSVLTSDEEHPGVLAPLAARARRARRRACAWSPFGGAGRRGAARRRGSWPDLARLVGDRRAWWTPPPLAADRRARCCSTARRASARCPSTCARSAATSTPRPARSGCAGPNGIGYLYATRELVAEPAGPWPGYHALEWAERRARARASAGRAALRPPASRRRTTSSGRIAALDVLEEAGFDARARARGRRWRDAARGAAPRPRCRGGAARALHARLLRGARPRGVRRARRASEGIVIRNLPGRAWARASVGAWNTEDELERLAELG